VTPDVEVEDAALRAANLAFSGRKREVASLASIELKNSDLRTLTARVLTPDGTWRQFMTVNYRRRK